MSRLLFGPVPSRRLGRSLGIDLIPYKTCSFDCIYCECHKTTNYSLERKEYYPVSNVIYEIDKFLKTKPKIDFITFAGSGEPTLYKKLGELINYLKENYPEYKLALLTNSSLLHQESLQNELLPLDLIIPSLDAVSEDVFIKINRPSENLKSVDVFEGLINFSKVFKGKIWGETFIVPGINDTPEELKLIKEIWSKISPEKIQINTLDRPGTESSLKAATYQQLLEIQEFLMPGPAEIIVSNHDSDFEICQDSKIKTAIFNTLQRRPCTVEDIKKMTGLKDAEISKFLLVLEKKGNIITKNEERGTFYFINKKGETDGLCN